MASSSASCSAERDAWFAWRFPSPDSDDLNAILDELKATAKGILAKRSLTSVEAQNAAKSSLYVISEPPVTPIQQEIRNAYDHALGEVQSAVAAFHFESQSATADFLIHIVGRLQRLKRTVSALREVAKEQLAAAKDQELEALMGAFRETWERLTAAAAQTERQVPWQLQYKLLVTDAQSRVDFEGAGITDAQGKLINVQECAASGVIIQNWAFGEGAPRYYCLDNGEALTTPCFAIVQQALAIRTRHFPSTFENDNDNDNKKEADERPPTIAEACRYLDGLRIDELWVLEHNIPTFLKFPVTGARNVAEAIASAFNTFATRPLFGTHARPDEPFRWLTYAAARDQVFDIALTLRYVFGLPAGHTTSVGLCMASNRPEWIFGLLAGLLNGFMAVGLMANWPLDELTYVCSDAGLSCFFVDAQTLPKIAAATRSLLTEHAKQVWIVCVDPLDEAQKASGDARIHIVELAELPRQLEAHRQQPQPQPQPLTTHTGMTPSSIVDCSATTSGALPIDNPDAVISLLYSSGSSGRPKGIVEQQSRWMVQLRRVSNHVPHVAMSYAPLAHGMDRGMIIDAFVNGGRVGFARFPEGTPEFFEELAVLQPAAFAAMPAFWTHLYNIAQQLQQQQQQSQAGEQTGGQSVVLDPRTVFGRRIRVIATGGSHTPRDVFEWMQSTWASDDVIVSNSYGLSECPGVSQNGKVLDSVQLRLAPVNLAGGESFSPDQQPPRGEILVRSPALTRGYWRLEQETSEAFTSDGFFRTGDIGMLDEEGRLHIIDRVKNFCEIYAEGRSIWVSTSRIETSLKNMPIIHEAYVHGDRMECALVAVLSLRSPASEQQLLADIRIELTAQGFAAHEIPSAVIISQEQWTVKSGLLLGIGKPNRRAIREAYQLQLSNVYLSLAELVN